MLLTLIRSFYRLWKTSIRCGGTRLIEDQAYGLETSSMPYFIGTIVSLGNVSSELHREFLYENDVYLFNTSFLAGLFWVF